MARAFASQIEGTNPGANYVLQYYFLNEAPGSDCTTDPAVAAWPAGNFVGALWAEAYGPVTAINKVTGLVPEEFGWTNSYTGDYVECSPITDGPACTDSPIILGNFTTDTEDVNGTCTIQGTDAGTQVVNGVQVTYSFPSTLVLVQSQAGEGTQIQASVTITRQSATPGVAACVRNYTALGFWPTAICNVANDCNPLPQPDLAPPGGPRPIGSGLLPGIPYTCSIGAGGLVGQDPIIAPDNVPSTDPATPCAIDGMGTDTCAAFADGDAGVAPGSCLNQTATDLGVPCTVDASGNDSCDSATGPGGVCIGSSSTGPGSCNSVTGTCAFPYLDGFGCGDGVPNGGSPFILQTGACGGGAKNNNSIADNTSAGPNQSGLCFFASPSATTFPYLTPQ